MDAGAGRITAATLSTGAVDGALQAGALLDQAGPLASFSAYGASDQDRVHGEVAARLPHAAVVVPRDPIQRTG